MRRSCIALLLLWPLLGAADPGALDPSFQFPMPAQFVPDTHTFVAMPDGWLAISSTSSSLPTRLTVTKLDADGRVDNRFGAGGSVVQAISQPDSFDLTAASRALPSGQVVLAGYSFDPASRLRRSAVARLDPLGRLDANFIGSNGVFTFDSPGEDDVIVGVDLLPGGELAALVYSRVEPFNYDDCLRDSVTLFRLDPSSAALRPGPIRVRDTFHAFSCRTSATLSVGPDGRVLFGHEQGVYREDDSPTTPSIVPGPGNGPFAGDESSSFVYSMIAGDSITIAVRGDPSSGRFTYSALGEAAGLGRYITWNKMAIDRERGFAYLGFGSYRGGAEAGVARFRLPSGELDSGWGDANGVVRVASPAGGGPYYFFGYGLSNEIRLLEVQASGDLVIGTAAGVLQRRKGGDGVAHGAFSLVENSLPLPRSRQTVSVRVQRLGGAIGPVSVDYSVEPATCDTNVHNGACIGSFGSASAGFDFVAAGGTLQWADGDVSDRIIEVSIPETIGPPEVFSVRLRNTTGGAGLIMSSTNLYLAAKDDVPAPTTRPPAPPQGPTGGGGGAVGWVTLAFLAFVARRRLARTETCPLPSACNHRAQTSRPWRSRRPVQLSKRYTGRVPWPQQDRPGNAIWSAIS